MKFHQHWLLTEHSNPKIGLYLTGKKTFMKALLGVQVRTSRLADLRMRKGLTIEIELDPKVFNGFIFKDYSKLKYSHGRGGSISVDADSSKFTLNGRTKTNRAISFTYIGKDAQDFSDIKAFQYDLFFGEGNDPKTINPADHHIHLDPVIRNDGTLP